MKHYISTPILVLSIALGTIGCASMFDRDQKIPLEQVPGKARTVIEQEAQGGHIKHIEKENEHGHATYEATIRKDAERIQVEVAEDGTVIEREMKRCEPETGD